MLKDSILCTHVYGLLRSSHKRNVKKCPTCRQYITSAFTVFVNWTVSLTLVLIDVMGLYIHNIRTVVYYMIVYYLKHKSRTIR